MPVHSVQLADLDCALSGTSAGGEWLREQCAQLEGGAVLYFPEIPAPMDAEDLAFLLGRIVVAFDS